MVERLDQLSCLVAVDLREASRAIAYRSCVDDWYLVAISVVEIIGGAQVAKVGVRAVLTLALVFGIGTVAASCATALGTLAQVACIDVFAMRFGRDGGVRRMRDVAHVDGQLAAPSTLVQSSLARRILQSFLR